MDPLRPASHHRRAVLLRAGLSGLLCAAGAPTAQAACPADADQIWGPPTASTTLLSLDSAAGSATDWKVCVLSGYAAAGGEIDVYVASGLTSFTLVGENPETPVPALKLRTVFSHSASGVVSYALEDLRLRPPDDATPGVWLRGPDVPGGGPGYHELALSSVSIDGDGHLLGVSDIGSTPQLRFSDTRYPAGAAPVSTCAPSTTVTLSADGLLPTGGPRTVPLVEPGDCDGSGNIVTFVGTHQESSPSTSVPGLVPDAGSVPPGDAFGRVNLGFFTAEDVHCDPCVSATESVEVWDSSWTLGDTGSLAGGTLLSVPSGTVGVRRMTFLTEGAAWRLVEADRAAVYRMEACMPGATGGADSAFHGSELDLWNSVVVHSGAPQPLWTSDSGITPRLRGVTVVSAVDDGSALPSTQDALNTLFVQPDGATGSPVPSDGPEDALVRRYADVFTSPAVATCGTHALPDAPWSGTRGKGRVRGPTGLPMIEHYCTELVDATAYGFDPAGASEACTAPTEAQSAWCDPDGTWPDVGAWSGPLADDDPQPDLAGVTPRACPPSGGGEDTAVEPDTADPTGSDSGEPTDSDSGGTSGTDPGDTRRDTASPSATDDGYRWGGTCGRAAAIWLPLALLPVWARRRRGHDRDGDTT